MSRRIPTYAVWIVVLAVVSTVEALSIVYVWPPSEYIRDQSIWLRLIALVTPVLWWELLCRVPRDDAPRFSISRIGGKFFLCLFLMAMLGQIGEKLAGLDLVDYRGPRDPLPDWVIPLYTKHAIIRGSATFAAFTSVAWSGAAAVALATSFRRATEELAWRRGLSTMLALAAIGGAIKILCEAGFAAFGSFFFVVSFACPLVAGLCGMVSARFAGGLTTVLCIASALIWFLLTMRHIQYYHASMAFFDWFFVLFGWLVCALSLALAAATAQRPDQKTPQNKAVNGSRR